MAAGDSVAEVATEDLVIERVFDAPRERVFDVFTKAEHIQKWWGPKGVSIPVAEFDARPGGRIFIGQTLPDSTEDTMLYLAGVVREIERPSHLMFAFHYANEERERVSPSARSGLPRAWNDEIVTTVTLSAEGRRTRVTIIAHRSGVTALWRERAREGWGQTLDKIDAAIADYMKEERGDLVVERVFDAPRERVFDMFTKTEHLRNWWGPKMASIAVAEYDARPGGKLFLGERYPDGAKVFLAGVVREIERPSHLVFAMHFANEKRERVPPPAHSGLGDAWDGEILSDVTFTAEGRRTRVTIRNERSGVTADWSEKARYGWGEALDKLEAALARA